MTDGEELLRLLYLCTPFTSLEYDYLIVLCCNDPHNIMTNGLKIPKRFFEKLKKAVEDNDVNLMNELSPPFPVEVTPQMLNCFNCGYDVVKPAVTGYENIDRISELLWALSKSRQMLIYNEDVKYRSIVEEKYKDEVLKILEDINSKITDEYFTEISNLCKAVFEGEEFLDVELNAFYNNLISICSK